MASDMPAPPGGSFGQQRNLGAAPMPTRRSGNALHVEPVEIGWSVSSDMSCPTSPVLQSHRFDIARLGAQCREASTNAVRLAGACSYSMFAPRIAGIERGAHKVTEVDGQHAGHRRAG